MGNFCQQVLKPLGSYTRVFTVCVTFVGFTGQMDYLKGDALNQQVRATASVSDYHTNCN